MFVARKSNHIQEDIQRGWSSWNFGEDGFSGTYRELQDFLSEATDTNPAWISGFEIYPDSINEFEFGELYPGYWVAIDRANAVNGLSCIDLDADTAEEAITEAVSRTDYWGDGESFDPSEFELIFSNDDIHVFKIKE